MRFLDLKREIGVLWAQWGLRGGGSWRYRMMVLCTELQTTEYLAKRRFMVQAFPTCARGGFPRTFWRGRCTAEGKGVFLTAFPRLNNREGV